MLAVAAVVYEAPTSYAYEAPAAAALPKELAAIHAAGMTLLACRIDRADMICEEMDASDRHGGADVN